MFAVPDGMSATDFKRHPVRQLIREAAYHGKRGLPSDAELDALGLSPALRATVREYCRDVAAVHSTGDQQNAWRLGDERAVTAIQALPDELRDPDHWRERDPLVNVTDPAELAALVPRM